MADTTNAYDVASVFLNVAQTVLLAWLAAGPARARGGYDRRAGAEKRRG